jgi:hypothetical protein
MFVHRSPGAGRRCAWVAALMLAWFVSGCSGAAAPTVPTSFATPAPLPTAALVAPSAAISPDPTADVPMAVAAETEAAAPTAAIPAAPADRRAVTVTILHTNDTRGEIEPCG